MKKKISESIQAKTFLSMLALLLACCVIIYAVVMVFLPKNYQAELESQATSDFYRLMETLERSGWEAGSEEILAFSMKNNATVRITDTDGSDVFSVNYADPENWEETDRTMTCSATFQEGWQTYQVSADISLVAVSQSYEILLKLIPLIAVVILLISVLAALVCSRYFSRPLIHICSVAKRMTSLDMTWKCEVKQRDEIGVLADSLNEMSERLNNALVSLQDANEQLQKDIEREREQEKQRIDFFTAVSHELKTPIALIQGYAEGLKEGVNDDPESREFYCEVIMDEAGKMNRMVKNLLALNQLEFGEDDVQFERFDITSLISGVLQSLDILIEQKEAQVIFRHKNPVYVWADEFKTEQVVRNYLTNAIHYVRKDGVIRISFKPMGNDIRVCVYNQGDWIAEEDIGRVFEKFYKADKARTREYGGNGIGLSIVAATMEAHGKKYGVENVADGVLFYFDLDANVLADK